MKNVLVVGFCFVFQAVSNRPSTGKLKIHVQAAFSFTKPRVSCISKLVHPWRGGAWERVVRVGER